MEINPYETGGWRVRFLSDDDQDPKAEVGGLLETLGFAILNHAQVFGPK